MSGRRGPLEASTTTTNAMRPRGSGGTPVRMSTFLLVHGMWCTSFHLSRVAARLEARGHRCIVPTLPRTATSSLQDYIGFLEAELAVHDVREPPVVLGHSLGGLLA